MPLTNPYSLKPTYITYLEGQGDLVNRLVMGITWVTMRVIRLIDLLTKSPDPPSNVLAEEGTPNFEERPH